VDALTYAARKPLINHIQEQRTRLFKIDIASNEQILNDIINTFKPDFVLNYASESHVCNSIKNPDKFISSNVKGTFSVLEAIRKSKHKPALIHISTDEVFGELKKDDPKFTEQTQIKPRSPYSATKAASDLLSLAWHETYGLDVIVTNSSNVFGPNQHEEKLIPKTIRAILKNQEVVVYGSGTQIRDWVFVKNHCQAIETLMKHRTPGERYLIGGDCELQNIDMIKFIHNVINRIYPNKYPELKIKHTNDRPSDDFRYAIDCSKLKSYGWDNGKNRILFNMIETVEHEAKSIRSI